MNIVRLGCLRFFACLLFAVCACFYAPDHSMAQTPVPTNLASLITSQLGAMTAGTITPAGAAANLNNASATPSPANLSNLTTMMQNILQNSNVSPTSATGLIGAVMTGNLSPVLGTALSSIPSLGNISTAAGLTSALQSLQGPIQALATAQQQAAAIGSALSALASPGGLAALASNPAFQNALASGLASSFPQLASTFGSLTQFANSLGQLGQALQSLTPTNLVNALIGGLLGGSNPLGGALAALLGGAGGSASGGTNNLNSYTIQPPIIANKNCCTPVAVNIPLHYFDVRNHVDFEFTQHRTWFLTTFWTNNILPALMLMSEQLTTTGILQIKMIGALLDAKHQLETQRLFQELTARAHKDYQPSEGMCTIGTMSRSLAASERLTNMSQAALAQRMMVRQTLNGDSLTTNSNDSDLYSRLDNFTKIYCMPSDNESGLSVLCPSVTKSARQDVDVDYTRNVESKLTLDTNFTQNNTNPTPDEQDLMALSANLFSNTVPAQIPEDYLGDGKGKVRVHAAEKLMDMRAILAKRSVAQNSFAAITALRASGDTQSAPYTKALIKELGVTNTTEIDALLGKEPSYFAQMEVLTKKLYQNPIFYTELYDKPTNVERKGAALQAIGLMQDRDLYNSLIRSEAVLSVLLETMLEKEQQKIVGAQKKLEGTGD